MLGVCIAAQSEMIRAIFSGDSPLLWDAIVGARPPLGGHVLQRASVDDGLKPYVSAQRGSNKH